MRNTRRSGGTKAAISYAASSALARQIESGAPADIFISADLDWMDYVEKRKLVKAGTRTNLLRNEIVLIAPADSKASFTIGPKFPLAKLLGDGRLAMADPDQRAGRQVRQGGAGDAGSMAVGGGSCRAGRKRDGLRSTFVSRGEAPFGIVYRTDAAADKKVRIVGAFPAEQPSADRLSRRPCSPKARVRQRRSTSSSSSRLKRRHLQEARLHAF